jgi:diacylglycerol kinase family enzyme
MKWLVLLNTKAGALERADDAGRPDERIAKRLADYGIDADVRGVDGDLLTDETRSAAASGNYAVVVAGGGDGTLNAVASGVVGTGVTFGVLPLGTHNHFAKELGMPLDLDDAVA